VRFIEDFEFEGHTCLVFELLALNLYELLKQTKFRGVSLDLVQTIGQQVLQVLSLLPQRVPSAVLSAARRALAVFSVSESTGCRHHPRRPQTGGAVESHASAMHGSNTLKPGGGDGVRTFFCPRTTKR
jgi:hypothetical protein